MSSHILQVSLCSGVPQQGTLRELSHCFLIDYSLPGLLAPKEQRQLLLIHFSLVVPAWLAPDVQRRHEGNLLKV